MTFFLFNSPYKRTPRGILKKFFEKLHVCVQLFAFSGVLVKGFVQGLIIRDGQE